MTSTIITCATTSPTMTTTATFEAASAAMVKVEATTLDPATAIAYIPNDG